MRKLMMTLTATALLLGTMAIAANATTLTTGAGSFHAQIQNATPLKLAACNGWGPYCPPGRVRVCGPYRCWCRPCY